MTSIVICNIILKAQCGFRSGTINYTRYNAVERNKAASILMVKRQNQIPIKQGGNFCRTFLTIEWCQQIEKSANIVTTFACTVVLCPFCFGSYCRSLMFFLHCRFPADTARTPACALLYACRKYWRTVDNVSIVSVSTLYQYSSVF